MHAHHPPIPPVVLTFPTSHRSRFAPLTAPRPGPPPRQPTAWTGRSSKRAVKPAGGKLLQGELDELALLDARCASGRLPGCIRVQQAAPTDFDASASNCPNDHCGWLSIEFSPFTSISPYGILRLSFRSHGEACRIALRQYRARSARTQVL